MVRNISHLNGKKYTRRFNRSNHITVKSQKFCYPCWSLYQKGLFLAFLEIRVGKYWEVGCGQVGHGSQTAWHHKPGDGSIGHEKVVPTCGSLVSGTWIMIIAFIQQGVSWDLYYFSFLIFSSISGESFT